MRILVSEKVLNLLHKQNIIQLNRSRPNQSGKKVMTLEVAVVLFLVAGIISEEVRYPLHLENGLRLQGYMWKPTEEHSTRAVVFISHG